MCTKAARSNDAKTTETHNEGKSSLHPCKFFPGSKSESEGGAHARYDNVAAHDAIMQTAISVV